LSISEQISPLVGRWVLAWFFLSEAWFCVQDWHGNVAALTKAGYPAAVLLLALILFIVLLGGLALILGFHTRQGAMLLFAFTIIMTVLADNYWNVSDPARRGLFYALYARNIAIAGGLLLLVGMGPGRFALDNTGKKG
jgi:putative oxidoreductase